MKCGVGKCGHCQINDKYVCVDGPVFSLRRDPEPRGGDLTWPRPKVAFFDFACCEGCQIEFTNYGDAGLPRAPQPRRHRRVPRGDVREDDGGASTSRSSRAASRARPTGRGSRRSAAARRIVIAYGAVRDDRRASTRSRTTRPTTPSSSTARTRRMPHLDERPGAADLGGDQGRLRGLRLPGEQVRGAADRLAPAARQGAGHPELPGLRRVQAPRDDLPLRRGRPLHGPDWRAPAAAPRARPTASRARRAAASSTTPTSAALKKVLMERAGFSRAAGRATSRGCSPPTRGKTRHDAEHPHRRPSPHPRRGSRQHRRQRDERRDREVRVAGARGAALLRGDGARAALHRGGAHHEPHLRHLLGRPHAGVGQGHRGGARHPGHRADAQAARAAQARRELRLARAARLLPGRAGPAGRAVGVPAGPDARRGRGARAAAQAPRATSGARSSAAAPRTRRRAVPGGFSKVPTDAGAPRAARPASWQAVPDLEATLATVAAAGREDPGLRPADRVHRALVGRGLRPLRRPHPVGAAGRREAALPGRPTTGRSPTSTWCRSPTAKYARNKLAELRGGRARALQQQLRQAAPGGQEGGRGAGHRSRSARTRT